MNILDKILLNCLELIAKEQSSHDAKKHGLVGAAIVSPDNHIVYSTSKIINKDKCKHAELCVIEKYEHLYGKLPKGCILFTTLSPCFEPMPGRVGLNCSELVSKHNITKIYTGLHDWSQEQYEPNFYDKMPFVLLESKDPNIKRLCEILLEKIDEVQDIEPSTKI